MLHGLASDSWVQVMSVSEVAETTGTHLGSYTQLPLFLYSPLFVGEAVLLLLLF